jgi:hypothetical protein
MPILIASEVMDLSAAALNDVDKTTYGYDVQIPYLKLAMQELQEIFELNSLSVTEQSSSAIPVNAGVSELTFNAPSQPRLPDNLIEPQQLWERTAGTFPWVEMSRREFIPHTLEGVEISQLLYWVWQQNKIKFLSSNGDNEVKIDYIGSLFPKYVRADTIIPVQNAIGYLSYKTAELISDMVEHNDARAQSNGARALLALDRITGITIKSKQQIQTRRRPFRAAYKRTNSW